jgi:hypothetical protein
LWDRFEEDEATRQIEGSEEPQGSFFQNLDSKESQNVFLGGLSIRGMPR